MQAARGAKHVRAVGALLAARLDETSGLEPLEHRVEQEVGGVTRNEAGAELAQRAEVEARVRQLEPERVLPVDPSPNRLRRFSVAQVLEVLQHRHEREAPRREARLAAPRVEGGEVLVAIEISELVPQSRRHRSPRKGQGRDAGRLDRHLADPLRLEAHGHHSTRSGAA